MNEVAYGKVTWGVYDMNEQYFVGRQDDLQQVDQHLLHVMTAQPRILLLEGLAGMGKTRFVEQIEARARRHEMRICVGRCYEDMAQPYAPFRSLLTYFEEERLVDDRGTSFLHVLAGRTAPSTDFASALDVLAIIHK